MVDDGPAGAGCLRSAVSVVTGLLFGMAPALQATRPDLASSMKEEGRGSSGSASRRRLRDTLIVVEVALAFVLLVGSGLMMRSFFRLHDRRHRASMRRTS